MEAERSHRRVSTIVSVLAASLTAAASIPAQPESLPHLHRQGAATQLIVDGKPFLVGGKFDIQRVRLYRYR